jgi:hypothetical protein
MLNQNPMSVMAQASKLSITQLQQAIKNGTVPPYIGVPLLQQKIKESQQAKQAMAAQQPQQPPIAQQVMQQAEAQGVDTLPSNLPVQGMAEGGIIAFDEGGEVKRFGLPDSKEQLVEDPDPYGYWAEHRRAEKARAPYVEGAKDFAFTGPRLIGREINYLGDVLSDTRDKNKMVIDPETGKPISVYELKRKAVNAVGKDAASQYRTSGKIDLPANPSFNLLGDNKASSVNPNQITANFMADANKPNTANPLAADATRGPSVEQGMTEAEIRAQYKDSAARGGAGAGKGSQGIDAFRIKPAEFDDKYLQNILASENNPATGKPYTPEEIKARRRDEEEKAGIDRTIYKSQRNELDDLKAKYKKGSKLDEAMPFFAAAEALTRPVKSGEAAPSFIGSLASGLGAYGKTSAELTDKQEAKLEKIRAESNALALAQNAFTQAEINGDRTEIKSAKDALNSHYKALSDFGIKKAEANALADAETKKIQAQIRMNENSVGATYYAADKASREIDQMAMQIQVDAAKAGMPISKSEATRKAYEDKAAGSIYGANLRDVASQRTSLTKAIGDIQKQYPMGIAMPPEVKARYTALTNQLNALGTGGGAESAGAAAVSNNPYGLTVSKG